MKELLSKISNARDIAHDRLINMTLTEVMILFIIVLNVFALVVGPTIDNSPETPQAPIESAR